MPHLKLAVRGFQVIPGAMLHGSDDL